MEKTVLNVEGMSCEHCVKAVEKAVGGLKGINSVSVDLGSKTVAIEYDSAECSIEQIKQEIEEQGYDVIK